MPPSQGMFWNYFSVGLDAKAAWSFHSLREEKPALASSRAANQFWYSAFSCTSGGGACVDKKGSQGRQERWLSPKGEVGFAHATLVHV